MRDENDQARWTRPCLSRTRTVPETASGDDHAIASVSDCAVAVGRQEAARCVDWEIAGARMSTKTVNGRSDRFAEASSAHSVTR